MNDNDYLPTASLSHLQARSHLLFELREFFRDHGYWECETPILSHDIVVDTNLEPFTTTQPDGSILYLQTSPEAGMKRLLAAGATAIFQVSRVMRRGERGRKHNPEFTMIEWYRVGDTHFDQMQFIETLVRRMYQSACDLDDSLSKRYQSWTQPFEQLNYDDAFERYAGERVLHKTGTKLLDFARRRNVTFPVGMSVDDRDGWLNLLLAELVEPHLGQSQPQFLCDYPASQAALARIKPDSHPPVAERFELYDRGLELCNGYHEITDVVELNRRTQAERDRRAEQGTFDLPGAPRMAAAMLAGIPPCCGVALGFDRLVMRALDVEKIDDVIAFPVDRA